MLSQIEEIKSRLNIVDLIQGYIRLNKAGTNFKAVCPFHNEKTPSFYVSPARQIWHCFGCQKGGDVFRFLMEIEGVDFPEALKTLAQKTGVILKKENKEISSEKNRLYGINETAVKFFQENLEKTPAGQKAKEYLISRGLKSQTIKEWRLGYALNNWDSLIKNLSAIGYKLEDVEKTGLIIKSNQPPAASRQPLNKHYDRFRGRIMFPIFDINEKIIAFGGRIFAESSEALAKEESEPVAKYINSPQTLIYDKSQVLYGLNKSKVEIRKANSTILVEGYMDLIAVWQAGFKNVAAVSGTALTDHHLLILKRYTDNLLTAFDMDEAGERATKRSLNLARSRGFNVKIITLGLPNAGEKIDPADLIKKSFEAWKKSVEEAREITQFYFENIFARFDAGSPEDKAKIAQNLLPEIKIIPNKIIQAHWIGELAKKINVREEDIREELKKTKKTEEIGETFISRANKTEKKSRQDLLFERLVALFLKYPEKKSLIARSSDFLRAHQASYIKDLDELLNNQPNHSDLYSQFSHLLVLDDEENSDFDPEIEINECLKELKGYCLRQTLNDLSKKIIQAEKEKNEENLAIFSRQFNEFSSQLIELI
ncbi:MAG: DNA primase [Parcubacteria group bacterium]|nr:DNA primase [Parcubacteria group bacterium]